MTDSLFDDADDNAWREVPQARFLSWSPRMQALYCAKRDYVSAEAATTAEEARWYIARAESYERLAKEN